MLTNTHIGLQPTSSSVISRMQLIKTNKPSPLDNSISDINNLPLDPPELLSARKSAMKPRIDSPACPSTALTSSTDPSAKDSGLTTAKVSDQLQWMAESSGRCDIIL